MPKAKNENIILKIRKIFLDYTKHPFIISKNYPSAILLSQINTENDSESNSTTEENEEIDYTIGNYLIKNTLGKGNFGKVKLGIYIPNNEKVAVKILEKYRIKENSDEIRVKREFEMLSKFNHINVILVAEIFESKDAYYSVMEYCEGGELFDYIVKHKRLSEDESSFFYFQLINGLEYIHSLGIVHRDLKPENLLLTKEKILKIIDFGLSNYSPPAGAGGAGGVLSTPCGSPCYASPEMVAGKNYDGFKIDIWSSGIVLFAMLCGYLPFEDKNNENLFKKILKCNVDYPKYISNEAKDLLNRILVNDPDKRINIENIKKHPFFIRGKNLFDEEFNISKYSSRSLSKNEHDFKITISNIDISNIDNSNEKSKNNKENINGLNADLLSLSNEKNYDTYNSSFKECNSKSFTSIKIQEKNIKKNLNKEKEIKNKNININSKKEKEINLKKELKREKYKYKNIFDINKYKNKLNKKRKESQNKKRINHNNLTIYTKGRKEFKIYKNKINFNSNIVNEYMFRNNFGNRKYLKTEINKKKENLKKINYRNKANSNILNRKKKFYSKKMVDDIQLTSNKNKSIKFNDFNSYNRNIKSEIKNKINPIREYIKLKNNSLSKHNTNINSTINTNTVSLNNSKNKKQKGNILLNKKINKNYIIDIKGQKKKFNIISNKNKKTNLKNYLKIAPKLELKEKNKNGGSKNKEKNKNKNLQIKFEPKANIIENSNNNYTITEIEEAKLKNNFKYLKTKNNINKLKNLNDILRKNIYLTRNINKTIQENSYYRHTTNNSFKNIPFATIRNNNNSKTFFHFKKIIHNPYLKKVYKKKDTVTVKNTVINLNMVNSNLIISSTSKKNSKKNNSLNKKKIININLNSNHQSQISQNISKNKIKEINNKINNKFKLTSNFNLKYNLFRNLYKKNVLNSSQTWARTESNEINVNKMKIKLDEIMHKLKQNFFLQNSKHVKFNSMRLDELNKNKLKKITKTKTTLLSKPLSKKNNINLLYLGNKTISPKVKIIKKYNSHINNIDETNSKNYSFQKLNKLPKNINNCKK